MAPRSRFSKSALWRYDSDELARIAIQAVPILIMPAICDTFLPIAPYDADANSISGDQFARAEVPEYADDNDLSCALRTAFLKAYNPLQDQILAITSIDSSDPAPQFKGIIRAHDDIAEPAFNGIITDLELLAIVRHNYDEYMSFMDHIARAPNPHLDTLLLIIDLDEFDIHCTQSPSNCETISRYFAAWSARLDLATVYKNYLGLDYPDCKDVSVYFGCPERARELDPQEEEESKRMGFRRVMSLLGCGTFHFHLDLICRSELFDDGVARMTSDFQLLMAHHITYLGMAMLQCGLSETEGKEAIEKCVD
ncbi:hypothetical protein VE04_08497, partial [Pseudogymnoascus sp. 24MN13]